MDTKLKISLSCRKPSVTFRSSVSQKWSHQIGSLGDPVSNLLKHFLHQDMPWHEGWWGNQVLAIGSGSSPTVSSHCWWLIPCYLARLGSMESADCPDAFLQRWCNHEGFNSHVMSNGSAGYEWVSMAMNKMIAVQNRIWWRRIKIWKHMWKQSFVECRQQRQKYRGIWLHLHSIKTLNNSTQGRRCMWHKAMIMLSFQYWGF